MLTLNHHHNNNCDDDFALIIIFIMLKLCYSIVILSNVVRVHHPSWVLINGGNALQSEDWNFMATNLEFHGPPLSTTDVLGFALLFFAFETRTRWKTNTRNVWTEEAKQIIKSLPNLNHGNLRGPPQCHPPQEIAGLIRGLLRDNDG